MALPPLSFWRTDGFEDDLDGPGGASRTAQVLFCLFAAVVAAGVLIASFGGLAHLPALARLPRLGLIGAPDEGPLAPLTATSTPAGATILVDGKPLGHTPATVGVPAGTRQLLLRLDGYADAAYPVVADHATHVTVEAVLWPRTPRVRRLRPPLPGASIVAYTFVANGRIAATLALPGSDERQLWLLDGDGGAERVGPSEAFAPLAIDPTGRRVAYLAHPRPEPGRAPAGASRTAGRASTPPVTELRLTVNGGEQLVDLAWSPDGAHLVLVSRGQTPTGAPRTRVLWLDPDAEGAEPRELVALPSDVVAGSWVWREDGLQLAFLAHSEGRTALCLLGTDGGFFRYLADVGGERFTPRLAPLAWAPPGWGDSIVYAVPVVLPEDPDGDRFPTLFIDDLSGHPPRRTGRPIAQSPAWTADGRIVALSRAGSDAPLAIRAIAPPATPGGAPGSANSPPLGLPEGYSPAAAEVRWDLAHAQALVLLPLGGGQGAFELWLVRWTGQG